MGTGDHNAGGKPWDGLASHPGGSKNILYYGQPTWSKRDQIPYKLDTSLIKTPP